MEKNCSEDSKKGHVVVNNCKKIERGILESLRLGSNDNNRKWKHLDSKENNQICVDAFARDGSSIDLYRRHSFCPHNNKMFKFGKMP